MSADLKLEAARTMDFITSSPTTSAAVDADSLPTAEVFEDAVDTTVVALTVVKRTSKTGNYRVTVTAAASDGFEVGKTYNVVATAVVGGITAKGTIGFFTVRARTADDFAWPTVSGRSIDLTAGQVTLGGCGSQVIGAGAFSAGALDAVWSTAVRRLSDGTNIVLAKGTGITGFNDILASDVWGVATRTLSAGTNIVLAKGVGLTGLNDLSAAQVNAEADTALLDIGATLTRMAFLDKLNVSGLVASAADIAAITQAARVRIVAPPLMEQPESGSTVFRVYIYVYNETHTAEDLDSTPTVTAENNTATSRSANCSAVSHPATGVYYFDYTVAAAHAVEGIVFKVVATEGAVATEYSTSTTVVDVDISSTLAAMAAKVDTLHDTRIPGVIQPQTGDSYARLGVPANASHAADVAAVKTDTAGTLLDTTNIKTRLPAALVGGRMDSYLGAALDGVLTAAKFASGAFDAVWSVAARILTAATNITSTGGTTVTQTGDAFARLGVPATTSISADLAAAKLVMDNTYTRLGAPVGGSLSVDMAAVKAAVDAVYTRQGAPAGASQSVDLAALKVVADATKVWTDRLGTSMVLDGSVYQFTANALELAPTGGGGGGGSGTDLQTINGASAPVDAFQDALTHKVLCTVDDSSGIPPTQREFEASGGLTIFPNGALRGRSIEWMSGTQRGAMQRITNYRKVNAVWRFTVEPALYAPAAGETFRIG